MRTMIKSIKSLGQKGDTLVEVLIAIAVVSSVLGIAYSVMNRNIATIRDNQERSEASKLASNQLELLKTGWQNDQNFLPGATGNFCISSTINIVTNPDPSNIAGGYHADCRLSVGGNDIYRANIVPNGSNGYTVTISWDKIGGGLSQVVMAYKFKGS